MSSPVKVPGAVAEPTERQPWGDGREPKRGALYTSQDHRIRAFAVDAIKARWAVS